MNIVVKYWNLNSMSQYRSARTFTRHYTIEMHTFSFKTNGMNAVWFLT